MKADYAKEKAELEESLPSLRRELESIEEANEDITEWLDLIERCVDIETLDRTTVLNMIDKIVVSESVKDEAAKKKTQELTINYRFIGSLLSNAKEGAAI
jgi:hypothetical protein